MLANSIIIDEYFASSKEKVAENRRVYMTDKILCIIVTNVCIIFNYYEKKNVFI